MLKTFSPWLPDEDSEAQGGQVTCSQSQSKVETERMPQMSLPNLFCLSKGNLNLYSLLQSFSATGK